MICGIRALDPPRKLDHRWDTNAPFEIVEKLTAPEGVGVVEEFPAGPLGDDGAAQITGRRAAGATEESSGLYPAQGVAVPRAAGGQPSDSFEEGSRLDRLRQVHLEARRERPIAVLGSRVGRERHRRYHDALVARPGPDFPDQDEAVVAGHREVTHDHVRPHAPGRRQPLADGVDRGHLGSPPTQDGGEQIAAVGVVVHDQDPNAVEVDGLCRDVAESDRIDEAVLRSAPRWGDPP